MVTSVQAMDQSVVLKTDWHLGIAALQYSLGVRTAVLVWFRAACSTVQRRGAVS